MPDPSLVACNIFRSMECPLGQLRNKHSSKSLIFNGFERFPGAPHYNHYLPYNISPLKPRPNFEPSGTQENGARLQESSRNAQRVFLDAEVSGGET